jgi:hypothetical protein
LLACRGGADRQNRARRIGGEYRWFRGSPPWRKLRPSALAEFLPLAAVDPDQPSGVDDVMADAVQFKYVPAPLSSQQLGELIQMPERRQ